MKTNVRSLGKVVILVLFVSNAALANDKPSGKLSAASPGAIAVSSAEPSPKVRKELLAAIDAWKQAVISKDRAGLEKAFHDDLSYGHTTGEVQTKAETVDRNLNHPGAFEAIDVTDLNIRVYGNVALLTAKFGFHSIQDGKRTVSDLSGLDVWIHGPNGWQLVARQLTRPPQ
jgi:ketosteroid isomerase-like protein